MAVASLRALPARRGLSHGDVRLGGDRQGAEISPAQFIPQQIGHAPLFSGLALATGGVAAMPMGAVRMNYMGHYVVTLAAAVLRPALYDDPRVGIRVAVILVIIFVVIVRRAVGAAACPGFGRFQVDRGPRAPCCPSPARYLYRRHRSQGAAGSRLAASAPAHRRLVMVPAQS